MDAVGGTRGLEVIAEVNISAQIEGNLLLVSSNRDTNLDFLSQPNFNDFPLDSKQMFVTAWERFFQEVLKDLGTH